MAFDPYLIWLDISPHERPVNYYRLFGLRPLEGDASTIAAAAQRVIAHVSQFQGSANVAECQQLLGELHAARACLLDPMRKAAYDRGFTSPGGGERVMTAPPVPGAPMQRPAATPYVAAGAASATPAWIAKTPTTPAQRPGERQIAATPPVPGALSAPASPVASPRPVYSPAALQQPTAREKPLTAPLQPSHPSGAIPFSTAPGAMAKTTPSPTAQGSTSYTAQPYAPSYTPAPQPQQPTASYVPPAVPTPPSAAPPQWAAAERTGRVGTVVANEQAGSAEISEPPRRIVRRQNNSTVIYVVAALAVAMIVFFFGAVLLLALFMASR